MATGKKQPVPRVFVAECSVGCTHQGQPRQLEAKELIPHDDKHLPHKVRVLVRMLRDATPEDRAAAIAYFSGPQPAFAKMIGDSQP